MLSSPFESIIAHLLSQKISAFVDLVTQNIKSPADNASTKVEHTYLGPMDSKLAQALMKCDADVKTKQIIFSCEVDSTDFSFTKKS